MLSKISSVSGFSEAYVSLLTLSSCFYSLLFRKAQERGLKIAFINPRKISFTKTARAEYSTALNADSQAIETSSFVKVSKLF